MAIRTHIGKQQESQEERPVQLRSTDPGSPEQDQLWLNTTEKRIKFFDGVSVQPTVSTVPNESVRTESTNYSIQPSDGMILGDASGGDITFDLPAAALNEGKKFIISKLDSSSNLVTIDANAAEEIDGKTTVELNREFQSIHIISDGSGWRIISSNIARYGKHVLTAPVSSNGAMTDLTFNNLVVGKSYRVRGAANFKSDGSTASAFAVDVKNGAAVLVTVPYASDLGNAAEGVGGFDVSFEATDTTITFELAGAGAGHSIEGTAADSKTYAFLEEDNMQQQTTEWD
jgi:hypothetical protein